MKKQSLKSVLGQLKEFLLPIVIVTLVIFLSVKVLVPKIKQLLEFRRQLKKNETEVLALEKKVTFLEEQQKGTLQADYEKVLQVLPDEKDVAALLVGLESLRKKTDLSFADFGLRPGVLATAGAEIEPDQMKNLGFDLKVSSSYDNLLKFLIGVEETTPLASVEKASVGFQSDKEVISSSLSLQTYYLPIKEETVPLEQPLPELSAPAKTTLKKMLDFEVVTYEVSLPEEEIGRENPFAPAEEKKATTAASF